MGPRLTLFSTPLLTPLMSRPLKNCFYRHFGVSESLGCTRRGRTLRKDAFLPSKYLLSAFYNIPPPSKNLVFTKKPYRRLLRTLLRSTYC